MRYAIALKLFVHLQLATLEFAGDCQLVDKDPCDYGNQYNLPSRAFPAAGGASVPLRPPENWGAQPLNPPNYRVYQ